MSRARLILFYMPLLLLASCENTFDVEVTGDANAPVLQFIDYPTILPLFPQDHVVCVYDIAVYEQASGEVAVANVIPTKHYCETTSGYTFNKPVRYFRQDAVFHPIPGRRYSIYVNTVDRKIPSGTERGLSGCLRFDGRKMVEVSC